MSRVNNDQIRQLSFYGILIFMAIFLFLQLSSFLPALLGAVTLYILMRGSMNYLVKKRKWKKGLAAITLMLCSLVIVMLPISLFVNVLYSKIGYAIQNSNQVVAALKLSINHFEAQYHVEIVSDKNLQQAATAVAETLPQIVGATFNSLIVVVILYFILYFLLVSSSRMEAWLTYHVPLKNENVNLIGNEIKTLVLSNAIGIPITAVLQGLLGAVAYWALGVNDIPFWFVVTCISAVIPMVGSAIAIIAVSILLYADGSGIKGTLMLLYGFGIMATLDSVFRIAIQRKMGNVHPLITTFGVILGVKLFGFIGLVFGPILLSVFILLMRIYINEFEEKNVAEDQPK
jgi:predicted PurR-regulated permease PerM